jgi:hypothetical protein
MGAMLRATRTMLGSCLDRVHDALDPRAATREPLALTPNSVGVAPLARRGSGCACPGLFISNVHALAERRNLHRRHLRQIQVAVLGLLRNVVAGLRGVGVRFLEVLVGLDSIGFVLLQIFLQLRAVGLGLLISAGVG